MKRAPRGALLARLAGLALVAATLIGGTAAASSSGHPMRFEHLTLDDGLSQSNVFAILQDSEGLMWFATEHGLNSYNGYEFEHYKRERGNPDALASDYIYDLAEDLNGNLWIATNGGGLTRMSLADRSFTSFRHDAGDPDSIASNVVRTLLVNEDGTIWLGTRGAGLDLFDPATGTFTHHEFTAADAAEKDPNEIYTLYRDAAGFLWIGSNRGLSRLDADSGEVMSYRHDPLDPGSISDDRVRAVFEDSAGRLWAGTYDGGLNLFDAESGSFTRFRHDPADPSSIASDRVTSIFEDLDGRLWVGTAGGLDLVDAAAGSFAHYQHDETDTASLGDNDVTALYQDRGGILWIGTRYRGLSRWNPNTWAYGLQAAKELSAGEERQPNVTAFVEDAAGVLWVGTFGDGLNAMNRETGDVVHYRKDGPAHRALTDDRVMSLLADSEGKIWIGTMTGGLNRLDPESGRIDVFRHDSGNPVSLSADGIMTLFEDSRARVWVGTFGGGISVYDRASGAFRRINADASAASALSSKRVTGFAEDPSGKIWIGTDAGGLNLYDPLSDSFHVFRHDPDDPHSLAADTVYSVNVDAGGTVWVGTRGGGLDRVVGSAERPDKILFENLSQRDGLANDVIYGVQFDESGRLWLSTNYGISQFDPKTRAIRNLHRKDGLQSEEFNFGAHYRSASGELFFGGHNGFNAFTPEAIKQNATVPPLMLTGVYNGNDPIKAGLPVDENDGIEISYKDDNLSFEFAALDYAAPALNSYRYKLEGFDSDWVDLGHRRRVSYTDLDDGRYLLRVQAANAEGVWNEAGLSIPVRVLPAPWDTWWAYLGYGAMFAQLIVMLWLGHQRKVRREEEYSHRLECEVRERTEKLLERNKQLNELNRTLQQSSLSDPLTGLRNRRFVFEEVSRDLDVARRKLGNERSGVDSRGVSDLVFMMIDLDNFKPINDTYGHAAGDQMLLQVRDVLLGACRRSDFVVRWGGDEFVVIAKQAIPGESEALAERIRSRIAAHSFLLEDGQIVRTTCSIGFAQYPLFRGRDDDSGLDQILGLADSLMYEAKKRRNAWAGLLGPSDAVTSFDFDHGEIESTSLLFRARRAGNLAKFQPDSPDELPKLALVR